MAIRDVGQAGPDVSVSWAGAHWALSLCVTVSQGWPATQGCWCRCVRCDVRQDWGAGSQCREHAECWAQISCHDNNPVLVTITGDMVDTISYTRQARPWQPETIGELAWSGGGHKTQVWWHGEGTPVLGAWQDMIITPCMWMWTLAVLRSVQSQAHGTGSFCSESQCIGNTSYERVLAWNPVSQARLRCDPSDQDHGGSAETGSWSHPVTLRSRVTDSQARVMSPRDVLIVLQCGDTHRDMVQPWCLGRMFYLQQLVIYKVLNVRLI